VTGTGAVNGIQVNVNYTPTLNFECPLPGVDCDASVSGPLTDAALFQVNGMTPGVVELAAVESVGSEFTAPAVVFALTFEWVGTTPGPGDFSIAPGSCQLVDQFGSPVPTADCAIGGLAVP
jgi:hypothetical protein